LYQNKRSFNLMQNRVEYRISLVSKLLPVKKQTPVNYSFSIKRNIENVLQRDSSDSFFLITFGKRGGKGMIND